MPKKHPNPDDVAFSVQLRLTPLEKEWLTIIAMRKGSSLARLISDEMKAYLDKTNKEYLERVYDELFDKLSEEQGYDTITEIPEEKVEHIFEEWTFD